VSALLDPDSFTICLTILKSLSLPTLLDSGSSDSFLDSLFVSKIKIKMKSITLIRLRLFDGTCNSMITETVEFLITFPTGKEFTLTFYVTSLDSSCSAVLGYSWLQQYNPLIDWSRNHITFQFTDHRGPAPSTSSGEAAPLREPTLTTPNSPAEIPEIWRTPEPSTLRMSDPPSPPYVLVTSPALRVSNSILQRKRSLVNPQPQPETRSTSPVFQRNTMSSLTSSARVKQKHSPNIALTTSKLTLRKVKLLLLVACTLSLRQSWVPSEPSLKTTLGAVSSDPPTLCMEL
jgi:hypothetical protein